MHQETASYTATAEKVGFLKSYWFPLVLLIPLIPFLIWDAQLDWNDVTDVVLYGIAFYLTVYLVYSRFWNRRPKKIHYQLTADELVIRIGSEKAIRYPLAVIKRWSVYSIEKPTVLVGDWTGGVYTGLWRWRGQELTLYSTRKDRLVLLDTTEGLIGLSPDEAEEAAFVQELEQRTGLTEAWGYFEPQYARKSGSIGLMVVTAVAAVMSVVITLELIWGSDNTYVEIARIALMMLLAASPRLLYPLQQRFPLLFKGIAVACCSLYVGVLYLS